MDSETTRRRSRWMMRALEWDDRRARYPNVWQDGMPRHVLAFETVASRLRLGDLLAVYYPASQRHPERSDRFRGDDSGREEPGVRAAIGQVPEDGLDHGGGDVAREDEKARGRAYDRPYSIMRNGKRAGNAPY